MDNATLKTRVRDHEVLRVYVAELPDVSADSASMRLSDRVFFDNVGESFTELLADGSTRHRSIEAVTMSLDGLTYRITLRKGMRFHCGAEIAADDAVASIMRVLRNHDSASQLHRFVAQSRVGSLELPVQAVSRYRIEIHLERRVSDLLQRLSLPEFILSHNGRSCFSGPWKVSSSYEGGLILMPHTDHPDAGQSEYKLIKVERIEAEHVGNLNFSGIPFVFAYEGTFCKSPPPEFLQDETVRTSHAGTSCFFRAEKPERIPADVRRALIVAARRFFSDNALWRRTALTSALPDGHLAHIPFVLDNGPDTDLSPRRVVIDATSCGIPERILESFAKYVQSESALTLEFVTAGLPVPATTDLRIEQMTSAHPADIYSPLCQQVRHPRLLKSAVFNDSEMKRKAPVVNYLQYLARDGHYIPFMFVPWMVRSNRPIRVDSELGNGKVVEFLSIGQSEIRSRRRKVQEKSLQAIGNAVQMFVHDVKRPFSLVQGILSLIESTDDSHRIREIVRKYIPDVKRTIKSVDGLIQDILEIGSDAEPACEDVAFGGLLLEILADVFVFEKDADIALSFRLEHGRLLFVDSHKLSRVLQNLLLNAVQAMRRSGRISITSKVVAGGNGARDFAEICIANTNSYIPPSKLNGLFERFYTEGNRKGTGLGLAITHKIITDHGGRIWCESEEDIGTRFHFTVPLSEDRDPSLTLAMPASARELQSGLRRPEDENKRVARLATSGLSVLMLDDDRLYLEVIRELLTAEEQIRHGITFTAVHEFQHAVEVFRQGGPTGKFNIVIADVDLGVKGENGLDFVREIRRRDEKVRICVHSNGSPFELQRRVIEAGGDLFLPKPMSRQHLISLLETTSKDQRLPVNNGQVVIVDDDALMVEMWESLGLFEILPFFSPEEFFERCASDDSFLSQVSVVITDFTFPESDLDGLDLIRVLRERGFSREVVLMTDRPLSSDQATDYTVLPKDIQKGVSYLASQVFRTKYNKQ